VSDRASDALFGRNFAATDAAGAHGIRRTPQAQEWQSIRGF